MAIQHIPSIIWGLSFRTLFTASGEPALYVVDDCSDGFIRRYTTWNGTGMMSVYLEEDGFIKADSDRTIICDVNGNPTAVTGIQRYFPASVMCPIELDDASGWWYRASEGLAVHKAGDNYPSSPEGGRGFRHGVAIWFETINGRKKMHQDEDFYYMSADSPMSPPYFKKVQSRGFLYDVQAGLLEGFTDNMTGTIYLTQ